MGILGTAAKAYVATRVIGSTHRRQQRRWAEQDVQAMATAPTGTAQATELDMNVVLEQLTQLGKLREAGVLTDAEFETQKQRILAAT